MQPLLKGSLIQEPTTARAVSDSRLFAQWEEDLPRKSSEIEKAVLLEMHARLVRFALNLPVRPKPVTKCHLSQFYQFSRTAFIFIYRLFYIFNTLRRLTR